MDIELWLSQFKRYWTNHEVEKVLELFDTDVAYFETPFQKLNSYDELNKAWGAIVNQKDINLEYSVYSAQDAKFSVIWKLSYKSGDDIMNFSGTYLIELNIQNKCTYFFHCCEEANR